MNFSKDKKQFLIVYQITNLLNNKIYIGAHCTNNINDNYMGSSKSLKKDIKELGKQNFEKIPLHVFDNQEDMRKKEAELVTKEFCLREDTYNIMKGGIQTFTWIGTVVVKDKDGNKSRVYKEDPRYLSGELVGVKTGINLSEEHKDKILQSHLGIKHTQETKEKMKLSRVGRIYTQETKDKISKSNLGKKRTQETKDKISQASKKQLRFPCTQEQKEKLRQANFGQKRTEEAKEKMRQSQLGKKRSQESIDKQNATRLKNKLIRLGS